MAEATIGVIMGIVTGFLLCLISVYEWSDRTVIKYETIYQNKLPKEIKLLKETDKYRRFVFEYELKNLKG